MCSFAEERLESVGTRVTGLLALQQTPKHADTAWKRTSQDNAKSCGDLESPLEIDQGLIRYVRSAMPFAKPITLCHGDPLAPWSAAPAQIVSCPLPHPPHVPDFYATHPHLASPDHPPTSSLAGLPCAPPPPWLFRCVSYQPHLFCPPHFTWEPHPLCLLHPSLFQSFFWLTCSSVRR